MIDLLAVIGIVWIVKILWKSGVLTMDKQKVLAAIAKVRRSLPGHPGNYDSGYTNRLHSALDEVIAAVGEPDKVLEISEQSLEEHIIAHLLLRKKQKERDGLAEKAKGVIEQLEK